jgi:hypothetical protein
MTDAITLLVAERDDELRHELIGQLLADGYQPSPARTAAETRCRAGPGPGPAAARRARRPDRGVAAAARAALGRPARRAARTGAACDRADPRRG